ncbi:MAG: hypothetical protein IPN94_02245 [Sphingobacteriales bacterium]|nr:hypothetical protein [Sphingobacteriales bacterium]
MSKIKKITIIITDLPDNSEEIDISIETAGKEKPRGVEAIQVLHSAIGSILDQIV